MQTTPLSKEKISHIAHSTPSNLSSSAASSAKTNMDSIPALESTVEEAEISSSYSANLINGTDSLGNKESTTNVEHISTVTDIISPSMTNSVVSVTEPKNTLKQLIKESEDCAVTATSPSSTELADPQQQGALLEQSEQGSTSSAPVSEGDSGIDPCAEGGEEDAGSGGTEGSEGDSLTNKTAPEAEGRDADASWSAAEGLAHTSDAASKVEQQDKKGEAFF